VRENSGCLEGPIAKGPTAEADAMICAECGAVPRLTYEITRTRHKLLLDPACEILPARVEIGRTGRDFPAHAQIAFHLRDKTARAGLGKMRETLYNWPGDQLWLVRVSLKRI
jgi:hypothetical protein